MGPPLGLFGALADQRSDRVGVRLLGKCALDLGQAALERPVEIAELRGEAVFDLVEPGGQRVEVAGDVLEPVAEAREPVRGVDHLAGFGQRELRTKPARRGAFRKGDGQALLGH